MSSVRITGTSNLISEDPVVADSFSWARYIVMHGLRTVPAALSVQGRGYGAKRIGQISSATLDTFKPTSEGPQANTVVGSEGECGVANLVTFSGDITSSGEMSLSAYGLETRSAFPHEGRRASFDSKRQSVHVALENYGLNCPVPAPPSPMRSKSALGRIISISVPRPQSLMKHNGQVDSLFDHDAEHFETNREGSYHRLSDEADIAIPVGSSVDLKVHELENQAEVSIIKDGTIGRELSDPCDNEGVARGGPVEENLNADMGDADLLLGKLKLAGGSAIDKARGIFCSRTLSLQSITTIGYDMDYTLIHYNMKAWEGKAYEYGVAQLRSMGYPCDGLKFDPSLVIQGLIMDKEKGNLVKADQFGYVKRAMHGTKMISNYAISEIYGQELVDLRNERRWEFLNTLFSISEAGLYMQMVAKLDEGSFPAELGFHDYESLHGVVAKALFKSHVEGKLKDEIISRPELFVEPDPDLPLALLDQREAGKRLLLITNSDYYYTNNMMQYAFNNYLPEGMHWRDLFDMVIVSSRKPEFFTVSHPLYEIVTEDGLMRPCFKAKPGGLYSGGSAAMVERALGVQGDETMYVGDHIYTDVNQPKVHLRWRTALICRELESEVHALINGREHQENLQQLTKHREDIADILNRLRLTHQRHLANRHPQVLTLSSCHSVHP